jgi:hypothetical protein
MYALSIGEGRFASKHGYGGPEATGTCGRGGKFLKSMLIILPVKYRMQSRCWLDSGGAKLTDSVRCRSIRGRTLRQIVRSRNRLKMELKFIENKERVPRSYWESDKSNSLDCGWFVRR